MTDWQPIETAPKDGRMILLGYLDKRGLFAARSARWALVHPNRKDEWWAWGWVCELGQHLLDQRATHWAPITVPQEIEPTND